MRTKVDIFFDNNPNKVFYGGQVLRGRVILSLPRDSTLKRIYVTIEGKALCQFGTMAHKHYHHQHETTFSGEEYYLSERINLVGDRDTEVFFCADIYTYTFECQLPEGLPTSLEGDFGFIRYSATVVLEYPMNPPKVFVQYISVLKKLDLNLDPFMREPLSVEHEKRFKYCWCFPYVSQPLLIKTKIPVKGYTPGQTIHVDFNVTNQSFNNVTNFSVQIIKCITYHIFENSIRRRIEQKQIAEKFTGIGCNRNQSQNLNVDVIVPPTPPTDTITSHICKVKYLLRIKALLGYFHQDPEFNIPIIIGTYPILDSNLSQAPEGSLVVALPDNSIDLPGQPILQRNRYSFPVVIRQLTQQSESVDSSNESRSVLRLSIPSRFCSIEQDVTPPPYPEMELPTYEEATQNKSENDSKNFAPVYPVYRCNTSYSLYSAQNE